MLTAVQAAALIAAIAFAVLAAAGVYLLVKLARLVSESCSVAAEFRTRSDLLLGRANSAVDRAHEQLARTDAITANMDEVSSNIAELTADVSMLTGAVRVLARSPLGQIAGFSFGVRRAIALRRSGPASARRMGGRAAGHADPARPDPARPDPARPDPARQAVRADARTGPAALPAGRIRTPRRGTRRRAPR